MLFRTTKRVNKKSWVASQRCIEPLEERVLLSVSGTPSQLSPAMIEQAYNLKNIVFNTGGQMINATGAGQTIAIVDAFGDANIASDLQTFDANFGISDNNNLGQFVLTVATPQGAVNPDSGWAAEQALDVEWAHAIAPEANILLVQANSSTVSALTDAVDWARSQPGVVAVSMSWGSIPDFSNETMDDPIFTTPSGHGGVTFVAASGDNGQPNYPSTSPNVLAIGGTTLTVDASGNFVSETPWSGSGGGHSDHEGTDKPDVAYDGNPSTGFLVYNSIPNNGITGWQVVGGTSAGAPQWAGILALVAQGRSLLGLNSLDGATQTIPQVDGLSSDNFNEVTGTGLTGLGSPIGSKVISALVGGGITSVSSNPAPSATQLAFGQQPTAVVAGAKINPSVTVLVKDSSGNTVTSDNSSVTISIASGPGSLVGTFTVTAVSGVAKFTNLSLKTAGSYTLRVTDGSLTGATSSSFSVTHAAASKLAYTQQPSDSTAGSAIGSIAVAIEDQFGNLVTSNSTIVTLGVSTGQGTLLGTTAVGAVNGVATFSNVNIRTSGGYTLNATDGSLTHIVSSSFNIRAGAASKLAYGQQPSDDIAGAAISPAILVEVEDQFGNVVITDSSSVSLMVNSGLGLLSGSAIVQAVNGVATFNNVSLNLMGNYTLKATEAGLSSATSSSFGISAGAASKLIFVQQPSDITAGGTITPGMTVEVQDQFGNEVFSGSPSITLSVGTGPGPLGGTVTVQAVGGIATFNNVSVNTAGGYTLQAGGSGLSAASSGSFNVSAGPAAQLGFVQQPTNAKAGGTISSVMVGVEDQFGNVVPGDASSVTISADSGPSTELEGTLTVQAVNGVATFSDLSLGVRGTYTIGAMDGAFAAATSGSFGVGVGDVGGSPATQVVFVHQADGLTAGAATPSAFVVNVVDQFGNLVASDNSKVKLSVVQGPHGSGAKGTVVVTAVGGVATFDNVLINVAGSYTLIAKDGKLTAGMSNAVIVNPTDPARLMYVQQPTNEIAGSAMNPSVVVELMDRFKNIATNDNSNVTVSILSGPAGATVSGTASATVVNGMAAFDNLILNTAGRYRLTASDGALLVASKGVVIQPGAAAAVSFVQPPQNVAAGQQFDSRIKISVTDAFGNAVANGAVVSLATRSGPAGGAVFGKLVAPVHKGMALFSNVTFQTLGDYTLTATAGLINVESNLFTVSAA